MRTVRRLWRILAVLTLIGVACRAPTPTAAPTAASAPTAAPTAAARPTSAPATAAPNTGTTVASTSQAAIAIKAAYPQPTAAVEAVYVGVDTGIFARNGVDVSLAQVAGPAQVAALGTGELQVGILGGNEIVNADVNGADVVAVATVSDFPIFSLYVQPKYASVEELAGQSIGVTSAGSTTDAVAHLFMQHYNMLDKVTIMAAGGSIPGVLAAVQQGTVAGGILSPPATAQAAAAGLRELINGVTLGVPLNHDSIAMTRKFIADNPDAVMRFLRAYAQAWTFCADPANEAAAVAAVQKYTGSSAADAKVGYDALKTVYTSKAVPTVDLEGMKNIMSLADNPRVKSADPAQFVDNSFVEKVKP